MTGRRLLPYAAAAAFASAYGIEWASNLGGLREAAGTVLLAIGCTLTGAWIILLARDHGDDA